jgi:cell division septation protein DedD
MEGSNGNMRPTDRNIDKRMIAVGVLGFLALAGVFFLLGVFCIGPLVRSHFGPSQEVSQAPTYTPPQPDTNAAESADSPEDLDVEITEQGEDQAATDGQASDEGVHRDGNDLTLTLESEDQTRPGAERSQSPAREQEHAERPKPTSGGQEHAAPSSGSHTYRVQVGTFANRTNADNLAADLKEKGYRVEVHSVQVEDRTLYRVQLGKYKAREDAQELASDLTGSGYNPTVVAE